MRQVTSLALCLAAFPWLGLTPLGQWGLASGDAIVFVVLLGSGIGLFLSTQTKAQLAEGLLEFLAEALLEALGHLIGGLLEGCCANSSFTFVLVMGLFSLAGLGLL